MRELKKKYFLVALIFICLFVSLRVLGVIDINLYKSNLVSNEVASISYTKLGSYNIIIKKNGNNIYNHIIMRGDQKAVIIIEAEIKDYKYKGNYYLPFYKNFTVEYKCDFSVPKSKDNNSNMVRGKIEGNINSEIIGLCSVKKAKEISENKAVESIKRYLVNSLSK